MKTIIFKIDFGKHLSLCSKPITDEKDLYFKRKIANHYNILLGQLVGIIIKEEEI